ncbi:hypothetical protein TNCV_4988031 [Trichonephila clavipes]|nr:hypothetical protein TNCV_4988031 [Trichonephila clavipes]
MSVYNDMINDKPGQTNGETSFFQMNPGSDYSIKMAASVFGGIVVTAHWQRAFVIGILAQELALWYRLLLGTRLDYLLFV